MKPLKIPIDNTPNQILNKYSRTNFAKSYAIIRMLRSIAGKQNYESAIKKLMNSDQPSVSVFYNALVLVSCLNFLFIYSHSFYFKLNFQNQKKNETQGDTAQMFVNEWTALDNYPKIRISSTVDMVNNKTTFYFKQEQFVAYSINDYDGKKSSKILHNKPWPILLECIAFDGSNAVEFKVYLRRRLEGLN